MAQTINSISSFMGDAFSDLSAIKASKGFMSLFGRGQSRTYFVENATQIAVDLQRGEKKISKILARAENEGLVSLGSNVGHAQAQKFQNVAYDFPIIREQGSVSYSDALKYRLMGEVDVNSGIDVMGRAREKIMEAVWTNMLKEVGKMEAVAAESMTTGKITLDSGEIYDFNRSTGNTITPSTLWTVTATASPIGDIDDACDAVQENGKASAAVGLIGYTALTAMVNTDEVKDTADNRRFEFVQAGSGTKRLPDLPADMQFIVDNGFKYMAYVQTFKGRSVYLFTYNEKYQDSSGTWTDYMNPKDVLILDHTARYDRYFGPRIRFDIETESEMIVNRMFGIDGMQQQFLNAQDVGGVVDARMFHMDAFLAADKTNIMVETYTGPLYVPTQIDAACLLDGVVA